MVGMAPMSASGASDLATWVKIGQKASPAFKESWGMYCSMYGGGINDPARHDPGYIGEFIHYLGQVAQADLSAAAQQAGMMAMQQAHSFSAPPMMSRKRPMDGG